MKQKVMYLSVTLILIIIVLLWHIFLPENGFYIWGVYFFFIPIIYSIAMFFKVKKISMIVAVSLTGMILSLLLSRDFVYSCFLLKLAATLLGCGVVCLFCKLRTESDIKK